MGVRIEVYFYEGRKERIMSIYSAGKLFDNLKEGRIAKAFFADEHWYVICDSGMIRYCNEDGTGIRDVVPLTFSNLKANYVMVGYRKS